MKIPTDWSKRRPVAIAHRAANGVLALRAAEAAGADLVEGDVWLYRGRLEVRHAKTMGRVPVLWDRWSIERGWAPRLSLDALLSALAPETGILLDLKGNDGALPDVVSPVLEQHSEQRVVAVCSQNWRLLAPFVEHPHITVVHSIGGTRALRAALSLGQRHPFEAVSVQKALLDMRTLAALKNVAPLVVAWPINDESTLDRLLCDGLDGAITDNIELVRAITARHHASV